jgi:hypothetical protein
VELGPENDLVFHRNRRAFSACLVVLVAGNRWVRWSLFFFSFCFFKVYIDQRGRRSTAELDELFERKVKPWRFHRTLTLTQRMAEMEEDATKER